MLNAKATRYALLSVLFFLSGFCGLLYQTVWLRLAFATFGVITPIISVVVAVFMMGLGLGSFWGGKSIAFLKRTSGLSAISFYAVIELIIGVGAFAVPAEFAISRELLLHCGASNSFMYLVLAGLAIMISILPWCLAMGATFPFVIEFLNEYKDESKRHFGLLYTANVAGALTGTLLTVFVLIELLGFQRVLTLAAIVNFLIAAVALTWGVLKGKLELIQTPISAADQSDTGSTRHNLTILFLTGFCSMGMEVAWTRAFAPILGSLVYSFALLLAVYLLSTWFGSFMYRTSSWQKCLSRRDGLISFMALAACLPTLANSPNIAHSTWDVLVHPLCPFSVYCFGIVLFSIVPFSVILGYLTPFLIDQTAKGDPALAGNAYAINIIGCIAGPLIAGYFLIPYLGAHLSLIVLTVPLVVLAVLPSLHVSRLAQWLCAASSLFLLFFTSLFSSWEEGGIYKLLGAHNVVIRRDYAATTLNFEYTGKKCLLVNGSSMTALSPICKYMSNLPLALHKGHPLSVLVICFGMGTSFRSALAWGADVTAVELVPGVKNSFGYYHDNAAQVLSNPNAHIVIDDGRRFLMRTQDKFDVVIVDPPPPAETIGTSLLYSQEFYDLVKKHLKPGGILQEWYGFPFDEKPILEAVARSLLSSFHYVSSYKAIKDKNVFGYHFLASDWPINEMTTKQMIERMPQKAKEDLQEWMPKEDAEQTMKEQISELLSAKTEPAIFLSPNKNIVITDDHPFNEYFFLRRLK